MFLPGEKAVVSTDWLTDPHVQGALVTLGVTPRVTVQATGVTPAWITPTPHPQGKTFRWATVVCDETTNYFDVPEHLLDRPQPEPFKQRDFLKGRDRDEWLADIDREQVLKTALMGMDLQWNGHHKQGTRWTMEGWRQPEEKRRKRLLTRSIGRYTVAREDMQAVIDAQEKGEALDRWVTIVVGNRDFCCPFCTDGTRFETNGLVVRPNEPCPNPDGLVTEWTMNFASGKVIVANDLRRLCRIASERGLDTTRSTHLLILDYAREGLALGFGIGNTSPHVFRMADGSFEIGKKMQRIWWVPEGTEGAVREPTYKGCEDESELRWYVTWQPADRTGEFDKYGDEWIDALPEGCEEVASVCTDLWAYCLLDLEEAKRRAVYYGHDLQTFDISIVDMEPGTYLFRHFHGADRDSPNVTFATFERVGDATEPEDWCAKDAAFTVDITQAVQHSVEHRPLLYGGGRDWAQQCYSVISSIFRGCVPERDWHRNGHRNDYLRADIESLPIKELPRFRFQGHWDIGQSVIDTTVSRNDKMFGGDILFNDSFAIAAGHVLESAISFGLPTRHDTNKTYPKDGEEIPNPKYDTFNVKGMRVEMRKAVKLWEGLIERYPHVAEALPDFATWVKSARHVNRWIKHFDLGPKKFDRAAHEAEEAEREAIRVRYLDVEAMQKPGCQVAIREGTDKGKLGITLENDGRCGEGQVIVQFELDLRDDGVVWEISLDRLTVGPEVLQARKDNLEAAVKRAVARMMEDDDY